MNSSIITTLIVLSAATVHGQPLQAKIKRGDEYLPFASKTLDSRPDYKVNPVNLELSRYGGWKARRHDQGTGFFRVKKINGRWWAIDPEGYLFIHKALNTVTSDYQNPDQVYGMLREHGFNGFGCWTWDGTTGRVEQNLIKASTVKNRIPMAYTPKVSFIGNYCRERLPKGTRRIELPVFDDGFETRAVEYAKEFMPYVNDPHVFGYFTDNELPFKTGLQDHLAITDPNDPNYKTAIHFLKKRGKTPATKDQDDVDAYTALIGERYFKVVRDAIRRVDPNHMIIGSRCHSAEKFNQAFMKNAGKYVDVFSANHYNHWGDRRFETRNMSEWSGRPLLFSEFYVMSSAGVKAATGAGYTSPDQTSRALFYQNYLSTYAESGSVVGFHWFKYGENGNNTGVVNQKGVFYTELLNSMKQMNKHLYDFINYADTRPAPDLVLAPEADAYFEGGANRGTLPDLKTKYASSSKSGSFRQTYLRFDVSSLKDPIDSAKIVLRSLLNGNAAGFFKAELVKNNTWGETTIERSNAPDGSTELHTFSDGGSDLEIDVSSVIAQAVAGDGKLSIRIVSTSPTGGGTPTYGSREHPDRVARPAMMVHFLKDKTPSSAHR